MRAFIVLAAVLLLLALVGWITFSSGPGRSSINLETVEIKKDTQNVMESGAKLLENAEEAIDQSDSPTQTPAPEPASPSRPMPQDQQPTDANSSLPQ